MQNKYISFTEAIEDALVVSMKKDKKVILLGEGVTDPKFIFNTTGKPFKLFGKSRVVETPVSENALTGIQIGMSLNNLKPILIHARVDFSLLSFDQIINNAAKWHFMFAGKMNVPIVIRMIIGRGWGQGPQHSQSLESIFAHYPGLKVVSPSTAADAKSLMIASIFDKNPVIFLEHRWTHYNSSKVKKGFYKSSLSESIDIKKKGSDLTILSSSIMTIEAIKVQSIFKKFDIRLEVCDLRVIRPLNINKLYKSVRKTRHLLVLDNGWKNFGLASEIITRVIEKQIPLKKMPVRLNQENFPSPSSTYLSKDYYVTLEKICKNIIKLLNIKKPIATKILKEVDILNKNLPHDLPNVNFKGPF